MESTSKVRSKYSETPTNWRTFERNIGTLTGVIDTPKRTETLLITTSNYLHFLTQAKIKIWRSKDDNLGLFL